MLVLRQVTRELSSATLLPLTYSDDGLGHVRLPVTSRRSHREPELLTSDRRAELTTSMGGALDLLLGWRR